MPEQIRCQKGFTLIEILIAMAISAIVMAAVVVLYRQQVRTQVTHQEVVKMEQNARAAMYYIERTLRMAGYNPTDSSTAGLAATFPGPPDIVACGGQATSNYLSFTTDDDASGTVDVNDSELLAFRLNGNRLERMSSGAVRWQLLIDNVDAMDFVYLDSTGARITIPADIPIRTSRIQVTIVVRSSQTLPGAFLQINDTQNYTNQQGDIILPAPNDGFRRLLLTCDVTCRNLNI